RSARHERDVLRDRLIQQLEAVDAGRQLHPDEHAALRRIPRDARREMFLERVEHYLAPLSVERADRGDVRVEEAVLDRFVNDALSEAWRVQIRRLLRLHQ